MEIRKTINCYCRNWVILAVILLLLNGCSWTKQLLWMDGETGTKENLPVDIEELVEMAEYCQQAYQTATDQNKLYEIKNNEFSYHVKQDRGVTILIFRGTDNRENIVTDLDFRPWYDEDLDIYLHRGFRDAAHVLYEDIKRNYRLERTVYLTGHSLGGAIAQIIGLWLDNDEYNIQIYTFGSPRISTTFLGNRPPHYRVIARNDPVPFVPPYPFLQSGILIDVKTLDWSESDDYASITEIDGRDHSISFYLDMLRRHD